MKGDVLFFLIGNILTFPFLHFRCDRSKGFATVSTLRHSFNVTQPSKRFVNVATLLLIIHYTGYKR